MRQFAPSRHAAVNANAGRKASAPTAMPHARTNPAGHGVSADLTAIPIRNRAAIALQTKLRVGDAADALESEADRVAERVMRMPASIPAPASAMRTTDAGSRQPVGKRTAPGIVHEVLESAGHPLDPAARHFMEPRFGRDFSHVRVHTDSKAAESAHALNALAYTSGNRTVFAAGQFAPGTESGRRLLAHELAHVVQQVPAGGLGGGAFVQRQEKHKDDVLDAGVPDDPLPGGVKDDKEEKKAEPDIPQMTDAQLGEAYRNESAKGESSRLGEIVAEMLVRMGAGQTLAGDRGPAPVVDGVGKLTPEVALELLNNMSEGKPAFKPELGLGGCSWFTTEGTPYTSVKPSQTIPVQVEIAKGTKPLTFREADLVKIFDQLADEASKLAEEQVRTKFNLPNAAKLSNKLLKEIKYKLKGTQEKLMWKKVGEQIATSAEKVGEIILEPGSQFSKTPGKFAAVADASKIGLKGGTKPLVEALGKEGVTAEKVVVEAAEALAKKMKWAGRVRNVFKYGGRVMIVVAIAADVVKIYRAKDHVKAVIESAGGWAGATAGSAAFAAWWTPADVAGPWAWAAHGVGTLISGGIGYWAGSAVTRTIYELVVE